MKSKEFIAKLKWLVNKVPNYYYSGTDWLRYDKTKGKFKMDCVLSVKGILWGFSADKNKDRGGAIYRSNGVPDFTCNGALNYCTGVSKDFSKITAGEYLCMKDTKYNHTGIYLGNGKVFECTTGWGVNKCVISNIDKNGVRSLNGKNNLKWTYHGKLKYIDYTDQEKQKETIKYDIIEPKKIEVIKDTNKWNLSFTAWNNAKSVEKLTKGQILEVVATYKHKLGGRYFITKEDYEKKLHYGINTQDCKDYVEVVNPITPPKQEEKPNEDKKEENKPTVKKTFWQILIDFLKQVFLRKQ